MVRGCACSRSTRITTLPIAESGLARARGHGFAKTSRFCTACTARLSRTRQAETTWWARTSGELAPTRAVAQALSTEDSDLLDPAAGLPLRWSANQGWQEPTLGHEQQPALSPDRGGAGHGNACPRGALSSLGPWIQRTHQAIDSPGGSHAQAAWLVAITLRALSPITPHRSCRPRSRALGQREGARSHRPAGRFRAGRPWCGRWRGRCR